MEINKIYNEDCLEGMKRIDDKSIDMILCDLPYGTTACKWDTVIPFVPLWKQYKRIIKDNGTIVLTASQPFTSDLVMSNVKMFKYELIWCKTSSADFVNAKNRPMKSHENILIFSNGNFANRCKNKMVYNPQGLIKIEKFRKVCKKPDIIGARKNQDNKLYLQDAKNYPLSWKIMPNDYDKLHPTQKPVTLFEYLIKTYTNEGNLVLDNCMGSGTTAIACVNTKRNYIGFELDKGYFDIAEKRIKEYKVEGKLFE